MASYTYQTETGGRSRVTACNKAAGNAWHAEDESGGVFWPDEEGRRLLAATNDPASMMLRFAYDCQHGTWHC